MAMKIIALTGYKQSGKSTVARILQEQFGFTRMAFADPIKWAVREIYDLSFAQLYGPGTLKEDVDPRYDLTPRQIMQRFGTEVCRQIHPDTWVMNLRRRMDTIEAPKGIVIDDLRFDNEAEAVHDWGGEVWHINRPGYRGDGHTSEALINAWDAWLWNNDSVAALTARVRKML